MYQSKMSEPEAVAFVEGHFNIRLKKSGTNEYQSLNGCPWCGDGGKGTKSDRFRLILGGRSDSPRVWCRQCEHTEFLDKLAGKSPHELTQEEILERRIARIEREQREIKERLTILEQMHRSTDHLAYHKNLTDSGLGIEYWTSEGMTPETIRDRKLGYCLSCPTYPQSPSYTIPVMFDGKLWNIRHRLKYPDGAGKYRPHRAGIPTMLFNADDIAKEGKAIMILEGEKKSMIVSQETGLLNIATMGAATFQRGWAAKFDKFQTVYVAYDPDVPDKAKTVTSHFGSRGRYVSLPVKADDFFVKYGGTKSDFLSFLKAARRVA